MPSFARIGSILQKVSARFGLEGKLLEYHLRRHWQEIAGAQIASHTWPDQIRFRKLYLLAESSVWAHQLSFLKPDLIDRINQATGHPTISDIVLRVGEIPHATDPGENEAAGAQLPGGMVPGEASMREAAEHAVHVHDPELRARLTKVMADALSRSERKQGPAATETTRWVR